MTALGGWGGPATTLPRGRLEHVPIEPRVLERRDDDLGPAVEKPLRAHGARAASRPAPGPARPGPSRRSRALSPPASSSQGLRALASSGTNSIDTRRQGQGRKQDRAHEDRDDPALAVLRGRDGRDLALRIRHGSGGYHPRERASVHKSQRQVKRCEPRSEPVANDQRLRDGTRAQDDLGQDEQAAGHAGRGSGGLQPGGAGSGGERHRRGEAVSSASGTRRGHGGRGRQPVGGGSRAYRVRGTRRPSQARTMRGPTAQRRESCSRNASTRADAPRLSAFQQPRGLPDGAGEVRVLGGGQIRRRRPPPAGAVESPIAGPRSRGHPGPPRARLERWARAAARRAARSASAQAPAHQQKRERSRTGRTRWTGSVRIRDVSAGEDLAGPRPPRRVRPIADRAEEQGRGRGQGGSGARARASRAIPRARGRERGVE